MENRRRKATRLEGFDYSQPAEYFVTICTKDRACVLGKVVEGVMVLSEAGRIAEAAWNDIPAHFRRVRADVLRVMPNHVHGIIEILDKPIPPRIPCGGGVPPPRCRGLINQTPTGDRVGWPLMAQRGISLGKIVRSFKARSCRLIHRSGMESFEWQRNYYDHIIRSDTERFYIERYIELNPLLWYFDRDNPCVHSIPFHPGTESNYPRLPFRVRRGGQAFPMIHRHWMLSRGTLAKRLLIGPLWVKFEQ